MNMEKFLQKFKKLRNLIVFDPGSKAAARARLVSYLRGTDAVRAQDAARLITYKSPLLTIIKNRPMPIVALITLLALLGGGTSFAAESALPGDFLYSVKVKVNEPVAAALHLSEDSKARFQAELAEKRLNEASALAAEGRLNSENEIELEGAFRSSAGNVETHLKSLESSGSTSTADEIGADFEDALRAYIAALQAGASSTGTDNLGRILSSVNLAIKASGRNRHGSENDSDNSRGQDDSSRGNASATDIELEHGAEVEIESPDDSQDSSLGVSSSLSVSVSDDADELLDDLGDDD